VSVKLRLVRMGKKKQPTYRIVAADSRSPRDGRFIEVLGTYMPRAEPSTVTLDNAKAVTWLGKGAQPTETVRKLLVISGAWAEFEGGRSGAVGVSTAGASATAPAPAGAANPPTPASTETPAAAGASDPGAPTAGERA
jgi:small subunit ribosomal protein S16